jgi:predicted nucleic acid-binding Zn ribbon protein
MPLFAMLISQLIVCSAPIKIWNKKHVCDSQSKLMHKNMLVRSNIIYLIFLLIIKIIYL